MDKETMVYPYSEILFGSKKEWSSDTCHSVDKPWKHCVQWKKPDTECHILYDSIFMTCLEYTNL